MSKALEDTPRAIRYREASAEDGAAIGLLHAQCWLRSSSNSALVSDVVAERLAIWRERSAQPDPALRLVVAESEGELVGFAYALARRDPQFGCLLDNLHVARAWQAQGIGSALLREIASWSAKLAPRDGLYLWLLPINRTSQAFYLRRGASALQAADAPATKRMPMLRYGWPRPVSLLAQGH